MIIYFKHHRYLYFTSLSGNIVLGLLVNLLLAFARKTKSTCVKTHTGNKKERLIAISVMKKRSFLNACYGTKEK